MLSITVCLTYDSRLLSFLEQRQICKAYLIARSETGQCTSNEEDSLFHETEMCELAVHLMWAIWGFDQHLRGEQIYFGYLVSLAHISIIYNSINTTSA